MLVQILGIVLTLFIGYCFGRVHLYKIMPYQQQIAEQSESELKKYVHMLVQAGLTAFSDAPTYIIKKSIIVNLLSEIEALQEASIDKTPVGFYDYLTTELERLRSTEDIFLKSETAEDKASKEE